ncbi:MAG TPA: hypothetical protein VK528_12260 [Flavobacterium sp.]|nr:hypothetical protein [Flavobacterium sp.]
MKNLFILLGILSLSIVQSQNLKPDREAFTLKVQLNKKQFYTQDINNLPYFPEAGTLQIYPDERINIEVEVLNGTIISLTSVAENVHPEKTIEIEFCQVIEDHITKSAQIFIKNPFDKKLKFKTVTYVINDSEWIPEPRSAKAKATECLVWKQTLGSFVMKDWELEKN